MKANNESEMAIIALYYIIARTKLTQTEKQALIFAVCKAIISKK